MIASTLERDLIEAEEELKSLDGERMVKKMEQIRLLKGRLERAKKSVFPGSGQQIQ